MDLISNATPILRRAWSVRLIFLLFVLGAAEMILPTLIGRLPGPWWIWPMAQSAVAIGALIARVTLQRNLKHD